MHTSSCCAPLPSSLVLNICLLYRGLPFIPCRRSIYAEELYLPSNDPADAYDLPPFPDAFGWISNRMLRLARNDGKRNVVLYISRAQGRHRSVTNEAELVATVKAALRPDLEFVHLVDPSQLGFTGAFSLSVPRSALCVRSGCTQGELALARPW